MPYGYGLISWKVAKMSRSKFGGVSGEAKNRRSPVISLGRACLSEELRTHADQVKSNTLGGLSKLNLWDTEPAGFEPKNYDVCSSWGLREWAGALSARLKLRRFFYLAYSAEERASEDFEERRSLLDKAADFFKDPSIGACVLSPKFFQKSPILDQSVAEYFYGSETIDDPRYADWVRRLEWEEGNAMQEAGDRTASQQIHVADIDGVETSVYEVAAWKMHREIDSLINSRLFLSVDLGVSDDVLVGEFKKWLKRTRLALGKVMMPKQYSCENFKQWHTDRLLPCVDLMFWAEIQGKKYTYERLGQILFNDSTVKIDCCGNDERMRRTLTKNARALVSDEIVSALNFQVIENSRI